jgi:hypothetical protein
MVELRAAHYERAGDPPPLVEHASARGGGVPDLGDPAVTVKSARNDPVRTKKTLLVVAALAAEGPASTALAARLAADAEGQVALYDEGASDRSVGRHDVVPEVTKAPCRREEADLGARIGRTAGRSS